nr:helicase HerA-like domain-containing protein [uncultured Actinomyces sp.]
MSENIEDLKARLAEAEAAAKAAEAEAARAKAEALRLQLEAAGATADTPAAAADAETTAETTPEAPASVGEAAQASSEVSGGLSAFASGIKAAYSWDVPAVTIGTLIEDGARVPGVSAKMPLPMFNRHLLVAGATGTGKTRTLQLLAEGLSAAGSSVLLCDVKGDLTGLAEAGASSEKLLSRTAANGQAWAPSSFPIELLSLGGADAQFPGVPVRAEVSDFGPILLARALSLNTTQEQALQLIFAWADGQGLKLVDLPDLRAVISFLTSDEGKDELAMIGGVSKATAGVILRALTALESQGGGQFFGAPGFDTADLMRMDSTGRGIVSLLGVGDISSRPALVSAVIMYLLANLFATLPEVGDAPRPTLVFFFDEAHLLFADATKEFERQVVQTVRLIRSKGVGVVFVTQTPKDIPSDVLAQLGSRVQHGLRASTPDDFKKLKATVQTFPKTDLELDEILTTLGTGEAVVTVLDPKGNPTPVTPVGIWAPASVMGPASADTIARINQSSVIMGRYRDAVNPDSAEEKLERRTAEAQAAREEAAAQEAATKEEEKARKEAEKAAEKAAKEAEKAVAKEEAAREKEMERLRRQVEKQQEKEEAARQRAAERRARQVENVLGSVLRTAGREITRSIFGMRKH